MEFKQHSEYQPTGDQPAAIANLVDGFKKGYQFQTLLGVTGSGKTFTMANIIQQLQRPTLVIAHNKTLAGQLYGEFKEFFPENAVEYFVSYYDEALRLFTEAAYIGNSTALYMVGLCDASHHGKLTEKDNDLENIIIKGRRFWNITQRGIKAYRERNYKVAIPLLKESSEEGICFAQLYLARCYLHGYGVKEDKEQAYKLAVASADQGWKYSQDFLKTYF